MDNFQVVQEILRAVAALLAAGVLITLLVGFTRGAGRAGDGD